MGRVDFGSRDSFVTLGQLIDEIAASEELIDDLITYAGELLTELTEQDASRD